MAKGIQLNTQTGEVKEIEVDIPPYEEIPAPIFPLQMMNALIKKGVITKADVEAEK